MIFQCGDRVQYGAFESGTSTCLFRFKEYPDRLLLMAAGHVVLPSFARQGDEIYATDSAGALQAIGRLLTWTSIDGDPTTDAALIWVSPNLVDARLRLGQGLAELKPQGTLSDGQPIQIGARPMLRNDSDPKIKSQRTDVDGVLVVGPDWAASTAITYKDQIVSDRLFTQGGDSGSLVVDADMQVVGMVVGADEDSRNGFTIITPFNALTDPAAWKGLTLELITSFDPAAFTDPLRPAVPAQGTVAPVGAGSAADETPVVTLDDPVRERISAAMRLNEIGDASPYKISFAGKGNSGASFGFMQGDLAAGQPVVRDTFEKVLSAANVAADKAQQLLAELSVPTVDNPLTPDDNALVNAALDSLDGQKLVNAMDQAILADVFNEVDRCIAAATDSHRGISLKALLYMAMWINMSGPPTTLLRWLGGDNVAFDSLASVPSPGAIIDGLAMEGYLRQTSYFSAHPANFKHLQQCAAAALT